MNYLFPILLVVASVAMFVGYTDPTYQSAVSNKSELVSYESALSDSKELVSIRQNLLDQYNSISEDDRNRLTELLPDSVDNIRLILEVATLGSRYGMVPKDVTFSNDAGSQASTGTLESQGPVGTITMTFTVSGSYQEFENLLSDLQSSLRLIDVTGISFAASPHDFSDYQVTITAYWLTPQQ